MQDYIVFDLETTGFSPETDEIIQIGAWKVIKGVVKDSFETLINPTKVIPSDITALTGITNEDCKDTPSVQEALFEFYEWCEDLPFLCHNISFDYNFIKYKGDLFGIDFSRNNTRKGICTLQLTRKYLPNISHKLCNIVEHYNIDIKTTDKFHQAPYDSYMTKLVYDRLLVFFGTNQDVIYPELLDKDADKYGKAETQNVLSFN